MKKLSYTIRIMVLVITVVLCVFLSGLRLLQIQIVDGEKYLSQAQANYTATQEIEAARGKIVDTNGVVLNSNEIVYKVIFQMAFIPDGTENSLIKNVIEIMEQSGEEWNETIPVSKTAPYTFNADSDAEIEVLKEKIGVAVYATAEDCIETLYGKFEISDEYSEEMRRKIAGVRYEMLLRDFSQYNRFTFAEDIKQETVIKLKERSFMLGGVDIIEEASRVYLKGTVAPHVLGTVGAISAEKYEALKEDSYKLNDIIGLSGIELAMESELRGERGERTIVRNTNGEAIADEVTKEPVPGNTVMLTIDSKFQTQIQEMLENHIKWLRQIPNGDERGKDAEAGAVVVLDVKNGGVLAMASYPSYDLNTLVDDYSAVLNAEGDPLYNRAIYGLYRPGSTFKTITSAAGLGIGIIDKTSTVYCGGIYTYFTDYQPHCYTGPHGNIDVRNALKVSCNIFYYDVGRRMGISNLADWAAKFGFGTDLKLEIGGSAGHMTTPELAEELGLTWNNGDVLQASIGQSETLVTPLNLAVQAMTIANKGVRYRPHLVKSVYDYDGKTKLYDVEPIVDYNIENMEENFETIIEGMVLVSDSAAYYNHDGVWANIYADIPGKVATKTGTPQQSETVYNSALVGFYPADDPQIAFGIIIEKGEFSRHLAVNIINTYLSGEYKPYLDEEGKIKYPY